MLLCEEQWDREVDVSAGFCQPSCEIPALPKILLFALALEMLPDSRSSSEVLTDDSSHPRAPGSTELSSDS